MTNTYPELDIILVGDANSITQNCIDSIEEPRANIIVEPYIGYNASLNRGYERTTAPLLAFCNNDLIFKSGWFDPLKQSLVHYSSVSPWCPQTHKLWWYRSRPVNAYSSYETGKCIAGWFIMMKRETYELIGGFDERFEFWCSDNSYAEQLKKHHLNHALVPQSEVIHLLSQTLNRQTRQKREQLTRGGILRFEAIFGKKLNIRI